MTDSAPSCFFCDSEDIVLPGIGIALGMSGNDYDFCDRCLSVPASEFWRQFFEMHSLDWPPTLASEGPE